MYHSSRILTVTVPIGADMPKRSSALRTTITLLTLALIGQAYAGVARAEPLPRGTSTPEARSAAARTESLAAASTQEPVPASGAAGAAGAAPAPDTATAATPALNWHRDQSATDRTAALATDRGATGRPANATSGGGISWETGTGKTYLIPALEELGFLTLLNAYDRTVLYNKREDDGERTYTTDLSTFWGHLRKQNWVYDTDPFNVNQFGHPYQGATMYGLARSTGLGFWESLAYSNAGSYLWEMGGENSRPSINDIITTGNSGSLLGEALFRMSELVLRNDGPEPDNWHELGAAVLSPTAAFNRWAFGERFKTIFPSHAPATFWRIRLGANINGNSEQTAALDFQMSYGLPGKPGYTYKRPFDYFDFQMGGLSKANNPLDYVLLRGLLYGRDYQAGENYRGVWGLYGGYDYLSPTAFRVSTTALSLGTTGQYWVAPGIALQGTYLGGVGFGAAGKTPTPAGDRDYHYGVTPQTLLALRLLFGDSVALEVIGRGYYVSGTGSDNAEGSELIARLNTGITVRVFRRHGIGLQFVESARDAHYGSQAKTHQSDGTVSIFYTFLGDSHFGAVEWRNQETR
jgi:hypothetical protein